MVDARFETDDRTAALNRAEQLDLREVQDDVRKAYERGRKDERARRRRHPIGMTLLFVVAACGAALLTLAAVNGSFSAGGSVADQSLHDAAQAAKAKAASPSN